MPPYPYAPANNFPYQQMYPSYGQMYPYHLNYPVQPNIQHFPQDISVQAPFNQQGGIHLVPNLPGASFYPRQDQSFPLFPPQSVATPYGNIPIEIIDVDAPVNNNESSNDVATTEAISLSAEETILSTTKSDEKKIIGINPKTVQTSSVIKSNPIEAKIIRKYDAKGLSVHVETSSLSPVNSENAVKDDNEFTDATTKNAFSFFG